MNKFIKKLFVLGSLIFFYSLPVNAKDLSDRNIRVGIVTEVKGSLISTSSEGTILLFNQNSYEKIADIKPQQPWAITNKNGNLNIVSGSKTFVVTDGKVIVKNNKVNGKYVPLVFAGKKWYRGSLEIFPSLRDKNEVTIVNILPVEEYLLGVVPSEMPSNWPIEALKTQAIAARTFALSHLGQFSKDGFDVMPTVISQVYGGAEEETEPSNKAVEETTGKVITYNSELISAYYYSSAGGITEDGQDAWGKYIPYIKSVPDFDQESPRYTWTKTINSQEIQSVLKKEFNQDIGLINSVSILETTASNRAKILRFEGENGIADIDARKFRLAIKLNSTLFKVIPMDLGATELNGRIIPNLFMFSGRGWGHGAGMSQWGARALAKLGKKSDEILRYYYQGTKISNADDVLSK